MYKRQIQGEITDTSTLTIKVSNISLQDLETALKPLAVKILDIREEKGT